MLNNFFKLCVLFSFFQNNINAFPVIDSIAQDSTLVNLLNLAKTHPTNWALILDIDGTLINFCDHQDPSTYQLIDLCIVDLIKDLQEAGVLVFAITSSLSLLKQLRTNALKKLGLDFSSSFLSTLGSQFELTDALVGANPVLFDGIIFTDKKDTYGPNSFSSKGCCLKALIDNLKNCGKDFPKNIIAIDDMLINLESEEKSCKKLGLNFFGFRFLYQGPYLANFFQGKL